MTISSEFKINHSVDGTGCCPRFNPDDWDGIELGFDRKPFVRAETRSIVHVPLNMGVVFSRVLGRIEKAGAEPPEGRLVMSRDLSPWKAEHLFAVSGVVPEEENTTLSGRFITRVFEGPYRFAPHWHEEMHQEAERRGSKTPEVWFFYTTCPKCAEAYGKNYVVGIARI